MIETYVDFDKMKSMTKEQFKMLNVGDKVYYVNGNDELNTLTADKYMNCHQNKVVYEAIITQITNHNIVMECTPVIGSIHEWPMFGEPKPHTESISFADACEKTEQWLYSTIEWEYVA